MAQFEHVRYAVEEGIATVMGSSALDKAGAHG
jgi:hypothetical protein